MDAEEYRKDLERKILFIIEEKLRSGKMDADRAKSIARMLLDKLHPPLTLSQLYQIVPTLDEHFNELTRAILQILHQRDEQVRAIVAKHAEMLIKAKQFDQAEAILNEALKAK